MEQTEIIDPKYAIRLADLRECHVITATCFKCGYQGALTAGFLAWERRPHTYLTKLEPKLCCTRCHNRAGNKLPMHRMPKNE
ncbi:MAG: hypothetical protein WAS21_14170 [Geminicoccaceae bacterium]